jgi:hypothetical protein
MIFPLPVSPKKPQTTIEHGIPLFLHLSISLNTFLFKIHSINKVFCLFRVYENVGVRSPVESSYHSFPRALLTLVLIIQSRNERALLKAFLQQFASGVICIFSYGKSEF